ncbi:MAG TPA: hypothetical protein PKI37_05525 [Candidatus Cloacimonas sp.]|nr:hypothetical protein [Candidatus Cloacimonas sp.]
MKKRDGEIVIFSHRKHRIHRKIFYKEKKRIIENEFSEIVRWRDGKREIAKYNFFLQREKEDFEQREKDKREKIENGEWRIEGER